MVATPAPTHPPARPQVGGSWVQAVATAADVILESFVSFDGCAGEPLGVDTGRLLYAAAYLYATAYLLQPIYAAAYLYATAYLYAAACLYATAYLLAFAPG